MISLANITKNHGQRVLFDSTTFQINSGEKIGLVGPNGAGKTSLFRLISGEEKPDSGEVSIPNRCVVAYFSQDVGEMKGRSALEEAKAGAGSISTMAERLATLENSLNSVDASVSEDQMMAMVEEYTDLQQRFETLGGYNLDSRAKTVLTGLGIGPDSYDLPVESFSGGWKMRIELAKMLLMAPDVLLMDEPTNHLDMESIEWLENWLQNFSGALLMTSHDREFMNRIVTRIVEVSQRKLVVYSGNYDFYEQEKQVRMSQLLAAHKKQQDMLAKEEEFIARFAARASHAAQVQSRVKKLDKIERVEIPPEEQTIHFEFPTPPRSGNDVVAIQSCAKVWTRSDGKEKLVFQGANAMVRRLEKVAVVGVNGAGKSSLLKIICGQTDATTGHCQLGANVKVGYFSQYSLDVLDPKKTVFEEVFDRVPEATISYVRSLCGAFLFSGDDVHKKISVLSGGEKSRVLLATLLANPVNLLILDEPTNHLDIKSREVLLEALKKFEGTILIVSHDRHFLRSLANRVFELDRGELRSYDGDWNYYRSKSPLAQRAH